MKKFRRLIFFRAFMLFLGLILLAYLLFKGNYFYALLLLPLCILLLWFTIRSQIRTYQELQEFAEAAKYRDFTRQFALDRASIEIHPLRVAFNNINDVFKKISSEREVQYQYLQKILELVDTAIISYEEESGKIMWINESFKALFAIPYFSTIHALEKKNKGLYHQIIESVPGDNGLFTFDTEQGSMKLQLHISNFQTAEGKYRLIALQNINAALDETESKAWQKLLSVLTHEIMNSIAPISSLADTIKNRLEGLPYVEELDDIRLGTETIKRRSEGLLKFAGTYRTLNKITQLDLTSIKAADLFENLYLLLEPTLIKKEIELDIILKDPSIELSVDINLIEQVLINLLLNAIEAVKNVDNPYIRLQALLINGRAQIKVSDNGKGMPQHIMDNIFTPFFTTRKTGSGVGLTLSKQIMLLHKGNILANSEEGKGSTFTLQF
ncbi:sensor histidine kinase [Albibacterium bauzanense]|uniref:histidine kinase n=1 Tax=Albibacterium bauzanense TaxID=653929 RepID=A0A4V2PY54_9SPHI|nr:HAMP domain-containing sensor histidine kinase [Albibacterium bauzanense]TCK84711.1 histidine kinase/DNA gyrase B/HSP90-like ATPase [Albibacterium bauzanense]